MLIDSLTQRAFLNYTTRVHSSDLEANLVMSSPKQMALEAQKVMEVPTVQASYANSPFW